MTTGPSAGGDMSTIREQYDDLCQRLQEAETEVSHDGKKTTWDLSTMRRERARLAALLNASTSSPRTCRTLLSMEPE